VNIEQAIFQNANDEFIIKAVHTVEEAVKLGEIKV
jgi:hypothetical protein